MRISPDVMLVVGALGVAAYLAAMGSHQPGQEWSLDRSSQADMVRFRIERRWPGSRWVTSSDRPLTDFQGLDMRASGRTQFEFVQDAGSLICEGRFFLGHGSGTFRVQTNPRFAAVLKELGYEAPTEQQLFEMILNPVSLDFARSLRDAGMRPSTHELLDLRNHGITADYIRAIRKSGFPADDVRELIELKNNGVSPEFLAALREAGYSSLTASRVTEIKNHGIGPDYLRDLAAFGLHPEPRDMIEFKNNGVEPQFLRDARELGFDFSPRELIDLKHQGVDSRYLRTVQASGIRNLTAGQIVKLKQHGVE